jgi:predicted SAM-dependent methyltransferase
MPSESTVTTTKEPSVHSKPIMLNLGCGSTYHEDWINLDLEPYSPTVLACDIRRGVPFESGTVDVCYSSHVLEHLRRDDAVRFIREQHRVLKRDGIIRIVVPDLERICRNYIEYLERAAGGDRSAHFRHHYSVLELLDQAVRDRRGGELGAVWKSGSLGEADLEFVLERHGREAVAAITGNAGGRLRRRTARDRFRQGFQQARLRISTLVVRALLGRRGVDAFREGWFRASGEVHRVMYDRLSLDRLLRSEGFEEIRVRAANDSRIPGFADYGLETVEGMERKPDSLYMEAISA